VSLRICFVTPFAWSQPHEVNAHVDGAARALRRLGHEVTVLAPSSHARDLLEGRRALQRGLDRDVIAVGPSIPISRRTHIGVPVGVRANLSLALRRGSFDVVHGFEPGLPSLSYLALTSSDALTAATFFSPERLGYPARRSRRDRLRIRVDALLATSEETMAAAADRFQGDYRLVPIGVDTELFHPRRKRRVIALELEIAGRPITRALIRSLRELEGWELHLLHTKPLAYRPAIPRSLRHRAHVRSVRRPDQRASVLGEASIFVPAPGGEERLALEAAACGAAVAEADDVAALVSDDARRSSLGAEGRARAESQSFDVVATQLDAVYTGLTRKRQQRRSRDEEDPLADRDWIAVDLHMHTSWSHDCSIEVEDLLDHAAEIGLGGIAVTDHNVFGGALEAVELADSRDLVVIPGEEVKTDDQGEIIGLFLEEEIPRGMSFGDTIAAIREQGGLVYLPHPFDRMHAIPDPATLHRHVAEIDVFEVFNARLLRESFNDEALRFARKYRLLQGAGSDAHVLQGVGTGALRMRRFEGPEEFLLSLRSAEILRRPKSLAYLQSLKWVAQVKEKVR
jgi:predicted metal-dependent phosphoesterase TrpH/glycosyltransferase involved in cell wall biosynthesis